MGCQGHGENATALPGVANRGFELSGILHSWKSYTSTKANKLLGRTGDFWQSEYYDHIIRNEEDFYNQLNYILSNPEKAGLENWPWVNIAEEIHG